MTRLKERSAVRSEVRVKGEVDSIKIDRVERLRVNERERETERVNQTGERGERKVE